MRPDLVPVSSDRSSRSDGSGELESAGSTIVVAGKSRVRRVRDGVAEGT